MSVSTKSRSSVLLLPEGSSLRSLGLRFFLMSIPPASPLLLRLQNQYKTLLVKFFIFEKSQTTAS